MRRKAKNLESTQVSDEEIQETYWVSSEPKGKLKVRNDIRWL